jgi:prephenate dehydratase
VKISASPSAEETPEKCSIVVDPEEDRPGLLYDLLSVFARRKINLCRIESRPSRRGIGSYVFFMDITTNPGWQDGLREISGITQVKQLGCYRRMEVPR